MAPTDEKTEVVLPAEVPEDLLLPSDPKVIFLGGLFVLAVLVVAFLEPEKVKNGKASSRNILGQGVTLASAILDRLGTYAKAFAYKWKPELNERSFILPARRKAPAAGQKSGRSAAPRRA